MAGESISAIGNGLGNIGQYNLYDPSMMSLMSGYGAMTNPMLNMSSMIGGYGMGMGYMGAMGGVGGTNYMDQYMDSLKKYNEYMEQMEERKLEHGIQMHKKAQLADVANLSSHDQAFFLKAVEDGDVQHCIRELHDAIRKGNMDYAIQTFFALKQVIYNRFSDYFGTQEGNVNTDEKVKQYICILYSEIAGGYASSNGVKPDLKDDILAYGEKPWQHGFNKTYLGNSGHSHYNAEEALNIMFGTGIDDIGTKKNAEKFGEWTGRVAEIATAGAAGTVAGAGALGLAKFFTPDFLTSGKRAQKLLAKNAVKNATKYSTWGKVAGLAAMGLDAWWQWSRD